MGSLPPGAMGPPLIGETLSFVRNPYGFLEDHRRRYGNVFKSHVAGRKVAFLAGTEGAEAFYDSENITRSEAHPFLMVDMFGGVNFEMYDGPRHLALQSIALEAFDPAAIAGYLPDIHSLIQSTLDRLANAGEFSATAELRRLAIEAICWNVLGLARGPETEALTREYGTLLAGLASFPVRVPRTPYRRAMAPPGPLLIPPPEGVQERRGGP